MKCILYMAMTANGMIAKLNDETPWSKEEWKSFTEIYKTCGNIIIGKRTFEILVGEKNFPYKKCFTVICSSKTNGTKLGEQILFVKSPEEALSALTRKGFKTALVAGGSKLNTAFMKAHLIDEILLDIEPKLFGKGIALFSESDGEYNLELLETKMLNGNTIQLHYKVLYTI